MAVVKETKEKMIRDQLAEDNRILSSDIEIKVSGSKVTLSGMVPSYYEKLSAEEDALATPGVYVVENNIMVTYPEETYVLSDSEIKSSIENMLQWDPRIDSSKITVTVQKGVITMEGSVDAFWKRRVAENTAFSISGIVDVNNKLNVVWTNELKDEKIAESIQNALKKSPLVNSAEIIVEVRNGIVNLRGRVSNLISKRVAADKVAYVEGVKGINNQLVVL
ncbi:BON domain-containing protein [Marivirga sp. S37H4]|uniref:BON domain-containing protein n=1 Tax=Marivirga aurantiaca TaxID=2802615 RepID=A0A934WZC0_9BACT|nr:BON domain-containing protein [Marivirga aurantiaca]MBK6265590.1 BON domain-containing protein [Marivirga aurantiaca]